MENESTGQFKVEVEKNNIIHLTLGNIDTPDKLYDLKNWAKKVKIVVQDVYKKTGNKVLAIIDISNLKKYDSESLLILAELMKGNESYVAKSATFGGDKFIVAGQDILLALSGRYNLKAFETKEEAISWLTAPSNK